jgi:hypothetical protein
MKANFVSVLNWLSTKLGGHRGEWRYSNTSFDLGTRWRLASRSFRFTHGERAPGTHWIGGWVGPRIGLDAVVKRKILYCRRSNHGRPARRPSLYRVRYSVSSLIIIIIIIIIIITIIAIIFTNSQVFSRKGNLKCLKIENLVFRGRPAFYYSSAYMLLPRK